LSTSRPSHWRDRIETIFEAWGTFACRHAVALILGVLLLSAALTSRVPLLETDVSTDSLLHEDDPVLIAYNQFREQFGRDERIVIAIEAPDIFDPVFLARLKRLHEDLDAGVPHVKEIISMLNARDTRGEGDRLIVEDLLEDWPETPQQLAALRERVLENPLYRNTLISQDAEVTTLSIELVAFAESADEEEALAGFEDDLKPERPAARPARQPELLGPTEQEEAVRAVGKIVERHEAPDFRLHLAGTPVMNQDMSDRMGEDMLRCSAACIAVIGVLLFLLFRRLAAVCLPLVVVLLSMLSTLGVMQLIGGKLSSATQIIPSFLLSVGVADSVHILAVYYHRLAAGSRKEDAISFALGHSALAVVMTSLTTAGGLGSFVIAPLKPVSDLGIYASFGVMFALAFTIVLLPALVAVTPARPVRRVEPGEPDAITRVLQKLGEFAVTRPWTVLAVTFAVLVVSFAGAARLRFSQNPLEWLPEGDRGREAWLFMNSKLGGINPVEVLIDTKRENGVVDPALLDRVEKLQVDAGKIRHGTIGIGKVISIVDVVKEINRALNENRRDFYTIPQDRDLLAQELLLFENSGSDDLADFVDPQFRIARVTAFMPAGDALDFQAPIADLRHLAETVVDHGASIEITGITYVLTGAFHAMITSMARSYVVALLVIAPMMVALIGRVRRGLLSMIPNITPVTMILGYMGWTGLPVDGLTIMVGAIVIGLAVDDTIHFMHNFRRYYARSDDARIAVRETLETTGRALLVTTLVLCAGFFVFATAYLSNVKVFGLLAGSAILIAFLANVLVTSSLMMLVTRREARRREA
jgi:predicted RND superfamily exporter protein